MGYSYVYPPLKKGAEQSLGPPGSGSSPLSLPPQRPLPTTQDSFQPPQQASRPAPQPSRPAPQPSRPAPQPSRPAPQLTSDNFPQQELDNFIPDFNPQEELQAFMQSIGDDFKDFNFAKSSRPARNNQVSHSNPAVLHTDYSSAQGHLGYPATHSSDHRLSEGFNQFQEI